MSVSVAAKAWMTQFAQAVRQQDFDAGSALFSDAVLGFGTRATRVLDLVQLQIEQWQFIWPNTTGFEFQLEAAVIQGQDDLLWIACPWFSWGVGADGNTFPRSGRATVVLNRQAGVWLAVHSHFSLDPSAL